MPTRSFEASVSLTPSLNVSKKWHFGQTKRKRKQFGIELLAAGQGQHWRSWPAAKRHVTLTRVGRMIDADNLAGGAKTLIDAMRDIGMLPDDSPAWLDVTFAQRAPRQGERPCTLVKVEVHA
jgi:hypothetical protein